MLIALRLRPSPRQRSRGSVASCPNNGLHPSQGSFLGSNGSSEMLSLTIGFWMRRDRLNVLAVHFRRDRLRQHAAQCSLNSVLKRAGNNLVLSGHHCLEALTRHVFRVVFLGL